MKTTALLAVSSLLFNVAQPVLAQAPGGGVDPQITTTLLQLMDVKDNTRPSSSDYDNTALKDIKTLGGPWGYELRTRYNFLGIPLAEALAPTDDERLHQQILELARWDRGADIRSVGLRQLAARKDPEAGKWCNEAINNPDPAVRFAGIEALEIWNKDPDLKLILEREVQTDTLPVLRIYAAQALLRRGDGMGRDELLKQLDSGSWVARAMAARYLGDLGIGDDYDLVLDRMGREQTNNFVIAEMAIAGLKLFPKKEPAAATTAAPPSAPVTAADDELEPLVITAPRLNIPATALIDGRINANLLRLLQTKASYRPTNDEIQDPGLQTLNKLVSPAGFMLNIRYTELDFLLTEGLAGSSDLLFRQNIVTAANSPATDPVVRAAAMMALAYNHDPADRGIFQQAMQAQSFTLRFAALEALQIWGKEGALEDIGNVARMDSSPFLQVYAAGAMIKLGDPSGRDILVRHWDDPDWVVRAITLHYLGLYGIPDDYPRIMEALQQEQNNWVKAEEAGTLLRLAKTLPKP